MYKASILAEDIERDAQFLGMTPEQFASVYLDKEEHGMNYLSKHKPCDFLQEDGLCKLGDCKPDSCKKYPYTDWYYVKTELTFERTTYAFLISS